MNEMVEQNILPDLYTFSVLIDALCKDGMVAEAQNTFSVMIQRGVEPNVVYQYVSVSGIEDYYSYHSQNAGFAGTVYINDLTGNVTIVNQIYSTGGELMPINVSLRLKSKARIFGK